MKEPAYNCNYYVRKYEKIDKILEMSNAWNELSESIGANLPWRCFEWFNLCCKYIEAENSKIKVFIVFNDKDIIALLPVWHIVEKYKGLFKANIARLVGSRQASTCSIIYSQSNSDMKNIVRVLMDAVMTDSPKYDIIEFDRMPDEDKSTKELKEYLDHHKINFKNNISTVNWYVNDLNCTGKDYFTRLPSAMKKDVEYCKRRLNREGNLEFLLIADECKIDEYLDMYDSVRESSWKAPEKDKEFIRDFTKMTFKKGWLRLGFLMFEGKPIAAQKWFLCHQYAHIYDVLYDDNYKKYSPGKVLTQMMFEYAIDVENAKCIDYLQGDEDYKKEWTHLKRDRCQIVIFNKSIKGILYYAILTKLKTILPAKKNMKLK